MTYVKASIPLKGMGVKKMDINSAFPGNKKPANKKKSIEKQLAHEAALLKKYDPDKKLKLEFEIASLEDLQKY